MPLWASGTEPIANEIDDGMAKPMPTPARPSQAAVTG